MWAGRYFPSRFWNSRYWAKLGADAPLATVLYPASVSLTNNGELKAVVSSGETSAVIGSGETKVRIVG